MEQCGVGASRGVNSGLEALSPLLTNPALLAQQQEHHPVTPTDPSEAVASYTQTEPHV